ncbi:MAG: tRNA lysidine(34) synthetase TilS [Candidatus Nanopelagicales bacterium]
MAESEAEYALTQPLRRRLSRMIEASVADLAASDLVLVAVSGGADSLALASLAADTAKRGLIRAGVVVVDHQLQSGSGEVARNAAVQCRDLGMNPVEVISVDVAQGPGSGGLEAAARTARRRALVAAARRHDARAILLGHTRDDQAETVLLGLARGSGARSLAAMVERDGLWRRPLLSATRQDTRLMCQLAGLSPYEDPHNSDPRFARVRVRRDVLPLMEDALGPGIAVALARTAQLLQADNAALDQWAAAQAETRLDVPGDGTATIDLGVGIDPLSAVPLAVRTRLYRLALLAGGCPPGALTAAHLGSIDRFVSDWRGQGPTRVPGDREVARAHDKLAFYPAAPLGSQ